MLIEESTNPTPILESAILSEGFEIAAKVTGKNEILKKASDCDPDFIVVNVSSPDDELLSQLKTINDLKPVVIFSEHAESAVIDTAVQAGVSAFIIDGLEEKRIKPVLEVALSRFKKYSELNNELTKTKENLANRKIIEKAKGLIMQQKHCTEDEAYNMLRKLAMDKNQKLNDVARNFIELSSLMT